MAGPDGTVGGLNSADEVLIVGTGAMACLFAARLSAHRHNVVMLGAWPEGAAALRARGVRLIDAVGRARSYPVRVTEDPRECAGVRNAIVLVKSWQTQRAANQLMQCLDEGGLALSLQNGLGNLEILAAALGSARSAAGTTTYAATLVAPGVVRPLGMGEVLLAQPKPEQFTALAPNRQYALDSILAHSNLKVRRVDDLRGLLWGKLVINSAINPVTALFDLKNGDIVRVREAWEKARELALETARVAAALDIPLPFLDPVAEVERVALATAENTSSMLADLRRGAPTEIDAINGAIVKYGATCGVPTPANLEMLRAIKTFCTLSGP